MFQLKKQGLEQCAVFVAGIMIKAGIDTKILNLPKDGALDDASDAATYCLWRSENEEKDKCPARTLMFYNHYDVQQRIY